MYEFTKVDTSKGPVTLTLPLNPRVGDFITFIDNSGTFSKNNLTLLGSVMNNTDNLVCDVDNYMISLVFDGSTWQITALNNDQVTDNHKLLSYSELIYDSPEPPGEPELGKRRIVLD